MLYWTRNILRLYQQTQHFLSHWCKASDSLHATVICRPVFSWQLYVHANIHTHTCSHTHMLAGAGSRWVISPKGTSTNGPLSNSTYLSRSHVLILQLSQATRCQLVVWDWVRNVFDMFAQLWPALHLSLLPDKYSSLRSNNAHLTIQLKGDVCAWMQLIWSLYRSSTRVKTGPTTGRTLVFLSHLMIISMGHDCGLFGLRLGYYDRH